MKAYISVALSRGLMDYVVKVKLSTVWHPASFEWVVEAFYQRNLAMDHTLYSVCRSSRAGACKTGMRVVEVTVRVQIVPGVCLSSTITCKLAQERCSTAGMAQQAQY